MKLIIIALMHLPGNYFWFIVDGEVAKAMRATQDHHLDELDLKEDLEFFMTSSPEPVAVGMLPLASGDDTEFELEIEDDFDFLDSRPSIDLKTRLAMMKLLGESDQ
ncbi:hypothetical protein CROQUDRAFT_658542 [Cronartium quercuum f. sp. fusiforme G11]|uniref:Uncharacterized protein n=1 Tax=Cronartium quercuum f. sp. fusiforme G11 TaxID=708437 RepID=A0A9P6TCC2_9BASI|nr:hypothetical protein CROQUDRAFT_658542 [Cronartium quercuum f. sp. fusiforme G11]